MLKNKLCSAEVLAYPDKKLQKKLNTDASSCTISGVLVQQSILLLFLWEKMVYTICGGETPMKKNKTTLPYMQLFKLHLIHIFLQKNLANVKKWTKNSHFRAKNHVLRNSCENTLQKMSNN